MANPLSRDGHLQRLAETKPTKADMDTAARVLRWLSNHAHFFPDEYGEDASCKLAWAADECGPNLEEIFLTTEAYVARDAHNARRGETDDFFRGWHDDPTRNI